MAQNVVGYFSYPCFALAHVAFYPVFAYSSISWHHSEPSSSFRIAVDVRYMHVHNTQYTSLVSVLSVGRKSKYNDITGSSHWERIQ
jgi:hypothetical protein